MKSLLAIITPLIFISCCFGNRKCKQDDNNSTFKIIDKTNGNDLVFGSTRVYDKNAIVFYSINAADTVIHNYGSGPGPNPGHDSLLYVEFDYRKFATVFIRLNTSDIDTISLSYPIEDASPCCTDYSIVKPVSLNGLQLERTTDGIIVLKK